MSLKHNFCWIVWILGSKHGQWVWQVVDAEERNPSEDEELLPTVGKLR